MQYHRNRNKKCDNKYREVIHTLLQTKRNRTQRRTIDVIPLIGLETEIAVAGICVFPDCNNGMLEMHYNVSEVHQCVAKTIIGAHSRKHYISPHQISGWYVA